MEVIRIENLYNHKAYLDNVVGWLYSEWGNNNPKYWEAWIKSSLNTVGIPQTYLTFVNDRLAGTYSLWRCDLQSCQDLFPWFGGLYVASPYRGRSFNGCKLGVLMQRHAIGLLRKMNYKEVYLFTEKSPKYYIANGWEIYDVVPDEKDKCVTVCRYNL